jgi:precorrin-4 methylase
LVVLYELAKESLQWQLVPGVVALQEAAAEWH